MIVPLELYGLSLRKGYLSPELVIGWRIGVSMREMFDGLADIRITVARDNDALLALSWLAQKNGQPRPIPLAGRRTAWDFLCYHPPTESLVKYVLIRRRSRPCEWMAGLAPLLGSEPSLLREFCQQEVDKQICFLLEQPVNDFAVVRQSRYRPFPMIEGDRRKRPCHSCGRLLCKDQLWEIEGDISCSECLGVESSWSAQNRMLAAGAPNPRPE